MRQLPSSELALVFVFLPLGLALVISSWEFLRSLVVGLNLGKEPSSG